MTEIPYISSKTNPINCDQSPTVSNTITMKDITTKLDIINKRIIFTPEHSGERRPTPNS